MSDPIRVLELRSVFGTGGGPEKTILFGAARTDRTRFDVTVCYLRHKNDTLFGIGERAEALPVSYVEIRERNSLDPNIWLQVRRLVRERRIQIVHSHDYKTDLLAWLPGQLEPIVPLATVHGWTGHTAIERRFYYPADKLLLRRFPIAIAVSGAIRAELLKWGCEAERVPVILNGIDHRRFRREPHQQAASRASLGLAADDVVIGSVGRLEPQKRFDLLIEAFAQVRAQHVKAQLVIAGEGSERPALEAQIAGANLQNCCRLLGHCQDVVRFHHALDLFVRSSEYEGTPNVVLEAMALETPLVVTDVGGTAELVRDQVDGIVVPPLSVDRLRNAIREAIENPALTLMRRTAARGRVEHDLSFDVRMNSLEQIYEQLARRETLDSNSRRLARLAT